jgi:N-acetylglucosamine-6-sulfatase
LDTYWPYAGPNQIAVRTDRYKLVDSFLKNDIDELYDLQNDPGEMTNLITLEQYDDVEDKLRQEAERLKEKYNYKADRDWWLRRVLKEKKIK